MRVCHLSFADGKGGAGRAAFRVHRSLLDVGIASHMIVADKVTDDDAVVLARNGLLGRWQRLLNPKLEKLRIRLRHGTPKSIFSPAHSAFHFDQQARNIIENAEAFCLYWVNFGFLAPESLALLAGRPVLWRLSDEWAYTGGCHYAGGCEGFLEECGSCPLLGAKCTNDYSRRLMERKQRAYESLDLTIVAPSRWILERARHSSLLSNAKFKLIPTGIDTQAFRPVERASARRALGLSSKGGYVLIGAANPANERKGGQWLKQIIEWGQDRKYEILTFGGTSLLPGTRHLGRLDDDGLRFAYSAADVFLAPSREENLANTVLEALACGTPVVAFDTGGMPDAIRQGENGGLATPYDLGALLEAAEAWIGTGLDRDRRDAICQSVLPTFTMQSQAKAFRQLLEREINRDRIKGIPV